VKWRDFMMIHIQKKIIASFDSGCNFTSVIDAVSLGNLSVTLSLISICRQ